MNEVEEEEKKEEEAEEMINNYSLSKTEMIRKYEKVHMINFPVYIVALTANAMAEDKQRCLLSGMNNFLSKPFSEFELSQVLIDAGKRKE